MAICRFAKLVEVFEAKYQTIPMTDPMINTCQTSPRNTGSDHDSFTDFFGAAVGAYRGSTDASDIK